MNKKAVIIKQQIKKKANNCLPALPPCTHREHILLLRLWLQGKGRSDAQIARKLPTELLRAPVASFRGMQVCVLIWEQALISSSKERCPEENAQDVCFKNMSIHSAMDEEKATKREPEHVHGRGRILTLWSFLPAEWPSPSLLTFYSHFPFNKLPCRIPPPAFVLPVLLLLIASTSHLEKMLETHLHWPWLTIMPLVPDPDVQLFLPCQESLAAGFTLCLQSKIQQLGIKLVAVIVVGCWVRRDECGAAGWERQTVSSALAAKDCLLSCQV